MMSFAALPAAPKILIITFILLGLSAVCGKTLTRHHATWRFCYNYKYLG
jgi:hypothetical protein